MSAGQIDLFDDDFIEEKVVVPKKPFLKTKCAVDISEQPGTAPRQYYLARETILSDLDRSSYLILGFDTEYQTLKDTFTQQEVKAGKARYEVLSYQFYAINFTGETWDGIAIPTRPGMRLTLGQFVVYAISKGAQLGYRIPKAIVLVSHYDRADLPAFDDWDQLVRKTQNVRNSLVSPSAPLVAEIQFSDDADDTEKLHLYLRDTMLLAAAGKKSLAALGNLIGVPKMKLADNPANETLLKKNMKSLRMYQWALFREYAIHDAKIAALYLQEVTRLREMALGERKFVPTTLSSIGVELLLREWENRFPKANALEMVGRERHKELVWSEKRGAYTNKNLKPYIEEVHWNLDFAAECFHGGRNEQFWFGPSFEDDWSDYDLTSAYPVAMAMLCKPDWRRVRDTTSLDELMETGGFGFACVEFRFPDGTRYPTLPVRTANGPIFPLEGRSYCCTPELIAARDLGCELRLRRGLIIPHDPEDKVFFPFIKDTIAKRRNAGPASEKAFWKEVTNSCYGKIAQGLREKRTYSLKSDGVESIPASKISNPFYAAMITSMVRATIGEIMNRLPASKMVFSVTTDGFITNASDEEAERAKQGPMAIRYGAMVVALTGEDDLLKEKHAVRQLLGWRTRGQATLIPGDYRDDDSHIVIARAGLKPPIWATTVDEQNNWVIKTFFNRTPGMEIPVDTHVTLKEQLAYGADLVTKRVSRKTPMEFDFKRKPHSVREVTACLPGSKRRYTHLVFSSGPWKNSDEFRRVRSIFDDYRKREGVCLKTTDDFRGFAEFVEIMWAASPGMHRFKSDPSGLSHLKRSLCRAFKKGHAGLEGMSDTMTAGRFAELLTQAGVPTTVEDVENGKRSPFKPNSTPKTAPVINALQQLSIMFPLLETSVIVAEQQEGTGPALADAINRDCQFVDRFDEMLPP